MKPTYLSILLASCMVITSAAAHLLTPNDFVWSHRPRQNLASPLPASFGTWTQEAGPDSLVVDPQVSERLAQVYSETVTRAYRNTDGERIMLSIAYGKDQRGEGRTHYPDVCYPAQGFQIGSTRSALVDIGRFQIPMNRLVATQGERVEPISYWLLVGNRLVSPGLSHKLSVIYYGLGGQIPDGLLVRISSIGTDTRAAYRQHDRFATDLLSALPSDQQSRLFGSPTQDASVPTHR